MYNGTRFTPTYSIFSVGVKESHSVSAVRVGNESAASPPMRCALVWRMTSVLSLSTAASKA